MIVRQNQQVSSPFTAEASDLPSASKLEIVDWQFDPVLMDRFASAGWATFHQYLLAGKVFCTFGTLFNELFCINFNEATKLWRVKHTVNDSETV